MHAEYELCSNLTNQIKYEKISSTMQVAMKAKKFLEVASLKEQRSVMGYTPTSEINAAEMRRRLKGLLVSLEVRHSQLVEEDDTSNCDLCLQFIEKVQRLLEL